MNATFAFDPIGIIRSCYTQKFGIPRQPRLATAARATLEILPPFDQDEAFNGLDAFSHLWIVFIFHGLPQGKWRSTVRPPRLGGNRRMGVFATRSGFRPNPIGMSAVVLGGMGRQGGKLCLELSGIDLLDGTPVLDIKPYLPYADIIAEAVGGFAAQAPDSAMPVTFTPEAEAACIRMESQYPDFINLIKQVLGADPRPAYVDQRAAKTEFGMRLYDQNIKWTVERGTIVVQGVDTVT